MATMASFKPADFMPKHVFYSYLAIKHIPIINGVEEVDDAVTTHIVVDTLAMPGDYTFRAGYLKLDGRQVWPVVTSAEGGLAAQLRIESRPDGLGLTKLTGSGGGLAPTPIGWKKELAGYFVAGFDLVTVVIPPNGYIALVGDISNGDTRIGLSVDGAPQKIHLTAGGATEPIYTAYRIADDGTIYTDDLKGHIDIAISEKGIYYVHYTNTAYKYLIIQAPADSALTVMTVNEVAQITEVAS